MALGLAGIPGVHVVPRVVEAQGGGQGHVMNTPSQIAVDCHVCLNLDFLRVEPAIRIAVQVCGRFFIYYCSLYGPLCILLSYHYQWGCYVPLYIYIIRK